MSEDFDLEFVPGTEAGEFDDQYVSETEDMLRLKFEPDYLAFLEKHNGGVPKKQIFPLGDDEKVVERFLSFVPDYEDNEEFGYYDVAVVWSQISDRLNEYLIPFAIVYAGDFLCFDYEGGGEQAKIVLWNHDYSREMKPYTIPVADNFRQFLSMLYADDEDGNSDE
ncbi:MAG: SMI1/KNR4 family protein [Acidobacteriota bacterium]|nr:SMI1/KNR4 family protein [Acidobacteriota bacterium]